MNDVKHTTMVTLGGWAMILFAVLFVGITLSIDHLAQSQPLLYGMEQHNLFKVAVGSTMIRNLLLIYALLPLLLIPGAVGVFYTFSEKYSPNMLVGLCFATLGALALAISLLLLPSMSWQLVSYIQNMPSATQSNMILLLQSVHSYFGILVGDVLGFGCLLVWFFIVSFVMLYSNMPRIIGLIELIITICATVILLLRFADITPTIHMMIRFPIIITLWIFICGIVLVSLHKAKERS